MNRHVKNVHGPTQAETETSTDENDRESVDTDDDENSTDEDSDTIDLIRSVFCCKSNFPSGEVFRQKILQLSAGKLRAFS